MSSVLVLALLITSQPTASPPLTPPRLRAGMISSDDYPASALAVRAEGVASVSLEVGGDGQVAECSVSATSGNAELDSTSCRLARQRFSFAPATSDGQPIPSTYNMRIRWSLPQPPASVERMTANPGI